MQGYTTMFLKAQEQFSAQGMIKPTHIFVQAGVGAPAASVAGFYHSVFGRDAPKCILVEPEKAACLFESMKYDDEEPHNVIGSLNTIMAGLSCGEPSPIAWNILKETADAFISCPDYVAAKGMNGGYLYMFGRHTTAPRRFSVSFSFVKGLEIRTGCKNSLFYRVFFTIHMECIKQ
jgi:diaminopropionate ammonia-lyase family